MILWYICRFLKATGTSTHAFMSDQSGRRVRPRFLHLKGDMTMSHGGEEERLDVLLCTSSHGNNLSTYMFWLWWNIEKRVLIISHGQGPSDKGNTRPSHLTVTRHSFNLSCQVHFLMHEPLIWCHLLCSLYAHVELITTCCDKQYT